MIWEAYFKSLLTPETKFLLFRPQDNATNGDCEHKEDLDGCPLSPSQDEGPKVLPAVSQEVMVSKALTRLRSLNTIYLK